LSPSLLLAFRGLTFRFKQTLLSMAGVTLGVVALTTILSVANGFEKGLIDSILETSGHIQVFSSQDHEISHPEDIARVVARVPGVIAVAPAIMVQGMIENEKEQTFSGCNIKCIDPSREVSINSIGHRMADGKFAFSGPNEILIGKDLARQLRVTAGKQLKMTIPDGTKYPLTVVGIFKTGLSDFDYQTILVPVALGQKAYGFADSVSHLFVRCADPMLARAIALQIHKDTAYDARSWLDTNRVLLEAISLERRVMFVVIFLTLIVAAFGIANVLTMVVLEKFRDIGIMRALGMRTREISRIFVVQGLAIGVSGTGLGCLGGWALGRLLQLIPIRLPLEVYYVDKVPVVFNPRDFVAIAGLALAVSLLASYFPARKAMRIQPVEAIRYYA
jgi:lipoprotein-releasing system permease protein